MEGLAFGRYRVTRRLGAGGMAEVYVAKHELMDRYAAVKVLLPEMSAREDIVKRFFQEAQAAACIEHPGIVHVYDVGYTEQGRAYLVMELLSGETLHQRLKRQKRLSLEATVTMIRQLAGVMEAAHQSGIIHRDLKPDNIFLVPDPEMPTGERVKVLDFGLAKLIEGVAPTGELTAQGAVFGTPAYMAPEQCKSAASVDGRADIYAIGCVFYACLCGKPPFGTGGIEVLLAHLADKPVPPRQHVPDIPPAIEALMLRLLEKNPARRFPTCEALIAELDVAIAATPRLAHGEGQRRPSVNDEVTIRKDATLQGTIAVVGALERAASQHDVSEPDTCETSAAHLVETQRMAAQLPMSGRASTNGALDNATRQMRKQPEGPFARTKRLQTPVPMPLPGVQPARPPSAQPVPGVSPMQASGPAPLPGVTSVRPPTAPPVQVSGPAPLAGLAPVQLPDPPAPGHAPVQPSGPGGMSPLYPMHVHAFAPADMPWRAGAPGSAGPRAGTDDDVRYGLGSTPTISNGEIEAHRQQTVTPDPGRARNRRMLWPVAGVVLAGLIATGFLLSSGESPKAELSSASAGAVDAPVLAAPMASAEQAPPAEPDPNLVKIDALLKQAEQDMDARAWEPATELLQRASKHEGIDEARQTRVLDMARRVAAEKENQAAFARMRELGGLRNVEKLVAEFGKIPADSVYHAEAHLLFEAARQEWLEAMGKRAERLVRNGECQTLASIVEDTARMFPGAEAELAAQSATCTAEAGEDADSAGHSPAQQVLAKVRADYNRGRPAAAFDRCHEAWELVSDDEQLTMLCGLAACKTKNHAAARQYYKKVSSRTRQDKIAQTCRREGLDIEK